MKPLNVTDAVKPLWQRSYAQIFALMVLVGPWLLIAFIATARRHLSAEDAEAVIAPVLTLWASLASVSGITTLAAGLASTWAKLRTQSELAIKGALPEPKPEPEQNDGGSQ